MFKHHQGHPNHFSNRRRTRGVLLSNVFPSIPGFVSLHSPHLYRSSSFTLLLFSNRKLTIGLRTFATSNQKIHSVDKNTMENNSKDHPVVSDGMNKKNKAQIWAIF